MRTPHKHAELIKAWADGAFIQSRYGEEEFTDCQCNRPSWNVDREYRIKPEPDYHQSKYEMTKD